MARFLRQWETKRSGLCPRSWIHDPPSRQVGVAKDCSNQRHRVPGNLIQGDL